MTESQRVWALALGHWVAVTLLCWWLYPVTVSDTLARYAPMADHFARGEWALAFHPRFGVLFEVLCGCSAKVLGVPGDLATQFVSLGFLSLSVVPLWFLLRKLFDPGIAWWTVALMLVNDDFSRYAMDGLRDTGKCLGFALVGFGMVLRRPGWLALGLFVLVSMFSYCFAVSAALLAGWCVWCARRRTWWDIAWSVFGWCAGTAAVVVLTHAYTGHWLPSPHYIKVLGGWL